MKTKLVRPVLLWLLVNSAMSFPQSAPHVVQGYEGEWNHVSGQLIGPAEAAPSEQSTVAAGDRSPLH